VKYAARRGVLFCRYVRVFIRAIKCILGCHSIGWIAEHSMAQFAMYFSMPVCKALTARACGCGFQDTTTGGTWLNHDGSTSRCGTWMNRKKLGKGVENSMSSGDEVHLVNPSMGRVSK